VARQNIINTDEIGDRVAAVSSAAAQVNELGRTVAEKMGETRDTAADAMHQASESLHHTARNLPGGDRVAGMAHTAADQLDSAAGYIAEHDAQEMLAEAGSWLKRHPGKSVVIAAALGFVVGRSFRGR
jgi:ElaB/YqjD/DUF883 family membrane-anchored ribosome-binding protein